MPDLEPGTLLVAPPGLPEDDPFWRTVVLVVDREPNGITTGIAVNRPLDQSVTGSSALALLFIPDPTASAFWGGPMGHDPAILAQFRSRDGLEWFHLAHQQQRPFPLPDVGVIAVAEHPSPFDARILRARLFIGLCVWGRQQLEREVEAGGWLLRSATAADVFAAEPARLWADLLTR